MKDNLLLPKLFMSSFVKPFTLIFGIVLLVVGILGFFNDPVLGIFDVDTNHNIVHLASGIVGILAAMNVMYARWYLVIFGLVYGVVTVLGFMEVGATGSTVGTLFGLMSINVADNWLHAAITVAALLVGLLGFKKSAAVPAM